MSDANVSDFHAACRDIIVCASNHAVNYAVSYARAGLQMTEWPEITVQCLYILNNITGWRGPIATTARNTFKRLAKAKAWELAA